MLIIAFLLLLLQGRPIVFKQTRTGKKFKPFVLYKFRTMQLNTEDKYGITLGHNDERITWFGRWLRTYKLDELPQLINVFKGDMSMVGPRPQIPYYTNKFKNIYQDILNIKPGIISQVAIKYKKEGELLENQKNPVAYFEKVVIPEKSIIDTALASNFTLKTYFKEIFIFFKLQF